MSCVNIESRSFVRRRKKNYWPKWRKAIPLQFCKNVGKWTYIFEYNTNSQKLLNQGGYIGHLYYSEIHSHDMTQGIET